MKILRLEKRKSILSILILTFLFLNSNIKSQTIIDFTDSNNGAISCNTSFIEDGFNIQSVPNGSSCTVINYPNGLCLCSGKIIIDLSSVININSVTIEFFENCFLVE